jgi:hypothetical protein|tara:strand:- start:80 stop:292 length:213 start_codon:yes stop_codon:yes gene_type:complete
MLKSNHRIEDILEEEDKDTPKCHKTIRARDRVLLGWDVTEDEPINLQDSGVYIPPQKALMGAEDVYSNLT